MRKTLSSVLFSLFLFAGIAMTVSAIDKKDDKKDTKKGHPPVIIIVWEPAWSPVMREFSVQSTANAFDLEGGNSVGAI